MSEIKSEASDPAIVFAGAVDVIQPPLPWALAVSGGSDSLALMHIAARWCAQSQTPKPVVLTVDHGLRPGSAQEAEQVGRWAGALGLDHRILSWRADKPASDLQAAARTARYKLMGNFCAVHKIPSLFLAHTEDDQAETFLLRLARGSGLDGLSGMTASAPLPLQDVCDQDARLVRPLLHVSRRNLRLFLESVGQEWVDDPSNTDESFARVRMRHLMPTLADQGLNTNRLAETAERLQDDRQFIAAAAADLARTCITLDDAGYIIMDGQRLAAAPAALALRVLGSALTAVGGAHYRPRAANLKRLFQAILGNDLESCRTLAGCHVEKWDNAGTYLITREWRSLNAKLTTEAPPIRLRPGQRVRWDHRLDLALTALAPSGEAARFEGEIRPLGPNGWRHLTDLCRDHGWPLPNVPRRARATLPGLWVGEELMSACPLENVRPGLVAGGQKCVDLRFQGRFATDIQGFRTAV